MAEPKLTYYRTAERPDIRLWLQDDDGNLVDFATGYTFAFKIGIRGKTADLTKTTGITGAAGSGTEASGTPNATIAFTAAELDALVAGKYHWQLRATTSGLDRVYQGDFELIDVIL
jgi:hypothetical protein